METLAFFDTKPYDRPHFSREAEAKGMEIRWLENKLNKTTAVLAKGCSAVCCFVNDEVDAACIDALRDNGVKAIALRCAGYNNVDLLRARSAGLRVFRVPAYSPESVAEHAAAMLFTLARKTHRAFTRTRERNFSLDGLVGTELSGKTVGVVGTGKVGLAFCRICQGMGMKVIASDPYPKWGCGIEYVRMDELFRRSDVISLHCPLTPESYRLINRSTFHYLKPGVIIINTSRGALIDSEALLEGIKSGKVGAAGLDVYEEEADVFYEDVSQKIMRDDTLNLLLSQPNVLVTSHQAFLTDEALRAIAAVTTDNLTRFYGGLPVENELHPTEETV